MNVFWLALLTALLWGSAPAFEKTGLGKLSPLTALTFRSLIITLILLSIAAVTGSAKELLSVDRRALLYIAIAGVLSGLLGQYVYYHALRLGDISRVVPVVATYPLAAALIGITLLREPITPGKIIGTVLVILGVIAIRLDSILWQK